MSLFCSHPRYVCTLERQRAFKYHSKNKENSLDFLKIFWVARGYSLYDTFIILFILLKPIRTIFNGFSFEWSMNFRFLYVFYTPAFIPRIRKIEKESKSHLCIFKLVCVWNDVNISVCLFFLWVLPIIFIMANLLLC